MKKNSGVALNYIGNAGEHYALSYLLSKGYSSCITQPGDIYDILSLIDNRYYRFQVKTTTGLGIRRKNLYAFEIRTKNRNKTNESFARGVNGYIFVSLNDNKIGFMKVTQNKKKDIYLRSRDVDYDRIRKRANYFQQPYLEDLTLSNFLMEVNEIKVGEKFAVNWQD